MYTISVSKLRRLLHVSDDDERFKPDFSSEVKTPPQKFDRIRTDKEKVLQNYLISF